MKFQAENILLFDKLQIRYYGIIIVVAMLIAAMVAARLAKRSKLDPDHIWGALTWAIIPGIVLARLWFVLLPPASLCPDPTVADKCQNAAWFMQNFFNLQNGAIAIWSGGLVIFGAVLGGALGAYIYMRRNKLPMLVWMDIAAVALPLGQAIGRLANYVNQELYGIPTTLPWGISIDVAHRVGIYKSLVDYPIDTRFHPLFLYEALWSLIAFFVLLNIYQRYRSRLLAGDVFLLWVAEYAVIRFLLEFIKVEVSYIPGTNINSAQVVCVAAFVVAVGILLYRHLEGRQPVTDAMPEAPSQPMTEGASAQQSTDKPAS
jgi:phosphatidylglycerol:prolipoprotein diacylglycerol transferase